MFGFHFLTLCFHYLGNDILGRDELIVGRISLLPTFIKRRQIYNFMFALFYLIYCCFGPMPNINHGLVNEVFYHFVGVGCNLRVYFAIDGIGIYCNKVNQCLLDFDFAWRSHLFGFGLVVDTLHIILVQVSQ